MPTVPNRLLPEGVRWQRDYRTTAVCIGCGNHPDDCTCDGSGKWNRVWIPYLCKHPVTFGVLAADFVRYDCHDCGWFSWRPR